MAKKATGAVNWKALRSCNGRTLLLRLLARFHCALIAAVLCAGVFEFLSTLNVFQALLPSQTVYLRGLLFAVPVALSDYAARKLPALWQYLLAALAITTLSWLLLGHVGGAVLGAVLCFFRGWNRIVEEKGRSAFDAPTYWALLVFLSTFLFSAFRGLPVLQQLSVISIVLYFLICLAFHGLERLEEYLALNRDMSALPARRIQRIVGGALCTALAFSAVLLFPAAFGASGEVRLELPEWRRVQSAPVIEESETSIMAPAQSMEALFGETEASSWQIPAFVSYLLYALAAGAIAALALYTAYKLVRHFRASYTDSHDVVQFLGGSTQEEKPYEGKTVGKRPDFLDRSPNAAIRRRYRKQVLRAVQEPPQSWQSPAEIEAWAGISAPKLHSLYEKARYGPVPCTQEDLRSLKSEKFGKEKT